jgi:hypothetical protein
MQYLMWVIILYGLFEIVSNTYHISKGSIIKIGQSAKKQHQEMPLDLKEIHFFIKVIIMLIFGFLFLICGLLYFLSPEESLTFCMVILISHGAYALIQALLYRYYFNVWGAVVVYNLPLITFLFLK